MNLQTALIVLVVILIVVIILCIPVVLQILQIARDTKTALQTINRSLPSIMQNVEEITANVNSSSDLINKKVQNYLTLTDRLFGNIIAAAKGAQVFAKVLFKKDLNQIQSP